MKLSPLKKYLIITYLLGWAIQILASAMLHTPKGKILFPLCLILCMYTPMLGTLFARKTLRGLGWHLHRKNLSVFLTAWLAPIFLTLLGAILYYLIFPSHLDLSGQSILTQYSLSSEQQSALSHKWHFILLTQILSSIFLAPIINIFTAIGEETGWRGFLYPLLKEKYGVAKGRILGGLIWGIWHWPIMILAGYNYGTNYMGAPLLGPVVFCISTVVFGIFLDALYQKSFSIWTCALGHGCINAVGGIPSLFYNPAFSSYQIFGPMPMGLISSIPFLITAIFLIHKNAT